MLRLFTAEGRARFVEYVSGGRHYGYAGYIEKFVLWITRELEALTGTTLEHEALCTYKTSKLLGGRGTDGSPPPPWKFPSVKAMTRVPDVITHVVRGDIGFTWEAAATVASHLSRSLDTYCGIAVDSGDFVFKDATREEASLWADAGFVYKFGDDSAEIANVSGESCSLTCSLPHAVHMGLLRSRLPVIFVFRRWHLFNRPDGHWRVWGGLEVPVPALRDWQQNVCKTWNGCSHHKPPVEDSPRVDFGWVAEDVWSGLDESINIRPDDYQASDVRPMIRDGKRITHYVRTTRRHKEAGPSMDTVAAVLSIESWPVSRE
jgi:hypothetical protein